MKNIIKSLCMGLSVWTIVAEASQSWAGTNLYYLQGLSDADQDAYIDKIASYGTQVVRLWVNGQSKGCQKGSNIARDIPALETTLGQYNAATLDELDKVLVKLVAKNIKAIISPHDANSLLGDYRKDVYSDAWSAGDFYTQQSAFDAYDNRLSYILNYQGASSGKVWKSWPEAILSFNLQNEPMTPSGSQCTNGDPSGWVCGRAEHLRGLLGSNQATLISTGGLGGDISHDCNFLPAATSCDAVDAISVHRYAGVPGGWSSALPGWISESNGKKVYVEEWGIDAAAYDQASAFGSEVSDMNSAGLPNLYWQILPAVADGCSYSPSDDSGDKFGIFDDAGVDLGGPIAAATDVEAAQDWGTSLGQASNATSAGRKRSLRLRKP